jgi:hypothetical protein
LLACSSPSTKRSFLVSASSMVSVVLICCRSANNELYISHGEVEIGDWRDETDMLRCNGWIGTIVEIWLFHR